MPNPQYRPEVSGATSPAKTAEAKSGPAARPYYQPGSLMDLPKEDRAYFRKLCKEAIEHWDDSTSEHMENLRRWNDLVEGVVEVTGWPWPGACEEDLRLAAIHLNSLHSVICRSMLTVSPLWFGRTFDQSIREAIPDVEDALDYYAKSELNTVSAVRLAVFAAGRDSISHTKTYWADEEVWVCEVLMPANADEFMQRFPDAESAGMDEDAFADAVAQMRLAENGQADMPNVSVEYPRVLYRGPKTDVIEEADWVQAPATAVDLHDCWAYGHAYHAGSLELGRRKHDGDFWPEAVKRLMSATPGDEGDNWKRQKDKIEGIQEKASKRSGQWRLYELVIICDFDQDGRDERYVCQYSKDRDILLAVVKYYQKAEMYRDWRLLRKPGRRLGFSIPGEVEGLIHEINDTYQQESNSSKIDSVPVFEVQEGIKKKMDESGFFDTFFKPGGTVGVPEIGKGVQQLKISPVDKASSQSRRQELVRYTEMLVGPTQMLSGRESPIDPEAPGNKTIALIQQSNMRIEDYINELRLSFDKLGEDYLALYGQFGPDRLPFASRSQAEREIERRVLAGDIKLATHGVTPMSNPEIEYAKSEKITANLLKDPFISGDPVRRREIYSRYMVAARVEGRDDILPTKAEVTGERDQQLEAAMREKVMGELVAKGIIPPPIPPATPGAIPAAAPGLPPALPMPGAPGGAAGLPPLNNLPPPV